MNESLNTESEKTVTASSDEHSLSASDVLNPMKANQPDYQDLVKEAAAVEVDTSLIPDTMPTEEELAAQKKAEDEAQAEYDKKIAAENQAAADEAALSADGNLSSQQASNGETGSAQDTTGSNPVQENVNPLDPAQADLADSATETSRKSKSRS